MKPFFHDRREAGRDLAFKLGRYAHHRDAVVLGLPRGGVVVGYEIARELGLEFDLFTVRKLGIPQSREIAMGAVASGGVRVLNKEVIAQMEISAEEIREVTRVESEELERRERLYRRNRPMVKIQGKTVILADDGIATGATISAAIQALRLRRVARVVVAVPVAHPLIRRDLSPIADQWVVLFTPEHFFAVGQWYDDFEQVNDADVCEILENARHRDLKFDEKWIVGEWIPLPSASRLHQQANSMERSMYHE